MKVLLVEDDRKVAGFIEQGLKEEGYVVDAAADGEEATMLAHVYDYDLILLDVMLPKKDGFAVCRELRAGNVHTPIIMLTARAQEIDKVLGLELGADDYITKPFSRRELHSRVKAALRRGALSPGPSAEIYELDGLIIDFRRCEIRRHGKTTELTALEIKLLRTFLGRRGQVVTIDQLNEAAWGKGVFITDRVVYTHINNLRKKIEDDPQAPRRLVTVRGVGYRFDS